MGYYSELSRNEAFYNILDSLKGKRKKIFEIILKYHPITDKEISLHSGLPINIVPARRKELQGFRWEFNPLTKKGEYIFHPDLEFVEFAGYKIIKGKKECMWKPSLKAFQIQKELEFR